MASPPPPDLMDELVGEILLRLPPDEPKHLFRAALVCKPWLRILCDPAFGRRYRALHGAPPLLGLLNMLMVNQEEPGPRIFSATSIPDFRLPGSDGRQTSPLDCRHGRVLIYNTLGDVGNKYLVWDPITGDKHGLRSPDIPWPVDSAAVLCAADGCDHLDCHGGPFRVVFMGTFEYEDNIVASVYSSETGVWSAQVSFDNSCEAFAKHMRDGCAERSWYTPYLLPSRATLIGDEIYFTIRRQHTIVKYDLSRNCLSIINSPPHNVYGIALMVMEDSSLGFACIQDSSLCTWSRKVNSEGGTEWVQFKVIKLESIIPAATSSSEPFVVGSAEGVGIIFISTDDGLFTIKLNSGQVKKVDKPDVYFSVLPYMSFYTPDRGSLLSLARTP